MYMLIGSLGQSILVGVPDKNFEFSPSQTLQMAFPRFLSIKLELAKLNSLKIKALPRETSLICRARLQICRLTPPQHPPPVAMGLLKAFLDLQVLFVILMVKREKYKTENTNTIIHVPLHQNNFNILNISYITSGLTLQVKTFHLT